VKSNKREEGSMLKEESIIRPEQTVPGRRSETRTAQARIDPMREDKLSYSSSLLQHCPNQAYRTIQNRSTEYDQVKQGR
jgi:hypothetical protein